MTKAYTDIEQSKKLAEFLPLESADMYYYTVNGDWVWYEIPNVIERRDDLDEHTIPAWSLSALLQIMPHCIDDKYGLGLAKLYGNDGWYVCYGDENNVDKQYVVKSNLLDACYEMILKLHTEKLI